MLAPADTRSQQKAILFKEQDGTDEKTNQGQTTESSETDSYTTSNLKY